MAYANAQTPQNRIAAIAGVAAIHAGIGAILIYGLATGSFVPPEVKKLVGGQINLDPPPPPPDPVEQPKTETPPSSRDVVAPTPPLDLSTNAPSLDTTDIILPPAPPVPKVYPSPLPTVSLPPPPPVPTPTFEPVAARPSNNPGSWVTQNDYRSSWISRGYAGTVGFRVSVGAGGKVESCSVTKSSGVSALDEATCQLVSRRARFDPAKNDQGRAVAGSYTGAVRWQIPE